MSDSVRILANRAAQAVQEGKFARVIDLAHEALDGQNFLEVNRVFKEIAGVDLCAGIVTSRHFSQVSLVNGGI